MSRSSSSIIKKDYNQISLDDFSDDSDEEYGVVPIRTRTNGSGMNGKSNGYSDRGPIAASSSSKDAASSFASSTMSSSNNNNPQQQQELLFQQQDQGLELLSVSAARLGTMSMAMGDELTAQNQILDEIDTDLHAATEQLDYVTRKTKEFIALMSGGTTQNCILIATLSGIVILLILLILYT